MRGSGMECADLAALSHSVGYWSCVRIRA